MKIAFLLTGDELMSGDTLDTNSSFMAQALKDYSIRPYNKQLVGDDLPLLVDAIQTLAEKSDVLIINGGLGPTVDDLTAQAVSLATQSKLIKNKDAMLWLERWAAQKNMALNDANKKQAFLPENTTIIPNSHGSAVGFSCEYLQCQIFCTPGVPSELKPMFRHFILPEILSRNTEKTDFYIQRLRLFGISESSLQQIIHDTFPDWSSEVIVGFRVQMPIIEVKIITRTEKNTALNDHWCQKFITHFSDYIIGKDNTTLVQSLHKVLARKTLTIATAESCTGGLVAAGLVQEAGISACFLGSVVSYHNDIKHKVLGVDMNAIKSIGVVSEEVAIQMAKGVLNKMQSDVAIAITGIAGPEGGDVKKPVGTVWVAVGSNKRIIAREYRLYGSRQWIQQQATALSMDLLRRYLLDLDTWPKYIRALKKQ